MSSSFHSSITHFRRILLGVLICRCLLAGYVTSIFDDSELKQTHLKKALHLRSLRSALGLDNVQSFTYPLASRSAVMISGRGFRPGKRYDEGFISFM
ncbi:hypothetical protein ACH3XW_28220 [Acanthocheilonema viteae]